MSTKIGLLLPTRELAMAGDFGTSSLLTIAQEAESVGYDSLWTGDSLTARRRLDPFVVLSAVASVTDRIGLGTAALTAALRHPVMSANIIASLDRHTNGRLALAVGAGFPVPESEDEFAAVGVPFKERVGRLDETVRMWRAIWGGERQAFEGKYWTSDKHDQLIPPAKLGGPRLWLAGSDTPKVIDRVARHYDGWLPFLPTPESYRRAWDRIAASAEKHGRPEGAITPGMYATVVVNKDRKAARDELDAYLKSYYGRPLEVMSTFQAYCYGSAEECADWLLEYAAAGCQHMVVRNATSGTRSGLAELLLEFRERVG
ncbi:LLM class flavin-dependent oxidoreductase [Rhodococcus sp. 14-2470-1b]|uniref:LLM class flavin-dependent oxidoreductase n=1 Tax=Rhodococcus sp. 14-2470-1b TaxID=2023149 RepID=UPI00113FD2DD|nr:LLM class flavin-dependent oxidoreductase [Rhodococcus sp. 14-2470-1b]